ncbi:hypothetical protein QSJ11_23080 [Vibrio parahaemolyticus]|nr:hypothetical protein QSJ11_23080 [Vibrio parahaemolyticus]
MDILLGWISWRLRGSDDMGVVITGSMRNVNMSFSEKEIFVGFERIKVYMGKEVGECDGKMVSFGNKR